VPLGHPELIRGSRTTLTCLTPQIIETLQKQGCYPAQMDEQGDNQSQNENQEGKWPQSHDGLNIVERKWLWGFP
jgi:hypothetical protein